MEKYEESELKLNKFSVPTSFHDMSVINMEISNGNIIIRFSLAKYLDEFNILKDDNYFAILEVKYDDIHISKIDLYGVINFRRLTVLRLTDINDIIELNLYNDEYDCYFNIAFTCESYNWKVIDIVTADEYYKYCDEISNNNDTLYEIQKYYGPIWSKI